MAFDFKKEYKEYYLPKNKPEIVTLVERKATAKLGRPVRVKAVDKNSAASKSKQMEQLLNFGRAHGDIVKIKED